MKPTTNPIAIRSKNELTKTLLDLMKTIPYSEISVKRILLESHLSKKTFYRNFDDKDDLLNSYLDTLLSEYTDRLKENNDYRFTQMLEVISTFVITNKEPLSLFWKNNLEYMVLQKLNQYIFSHHCINANYEHSRIEDYIVMFNNGAIWNVLNEWMRSGCTDSIDKILLGLKSYIKRMDEIDLLDFIL